MNITRTQLRKRVAAGIKLISWRQHSRQWVNSINLDTLVMSSFNSCILAKLYGGYDDGCRKVFGNNGYGTQKEMDFGFHPSMLHEKNKPNFVSSKRLNNEWKRQLQQIKQEMKLAA